RLPADAPYPLASPTVAARLLTLRIRSPRLRLRLALPSIDPATPRGDTDHRHRHRRRCDNRDRAPWPRAPRLPDPDAPVVRLIDVCRIFIGPELKDHLVERFIGHSEEHVGSTVLHAAAGALVDEGPRPVREDADAKRQRLYRHPPTPEVAEEEAQLRGVPGGPERGGDHEPALDELAWAPMGQRFTRGTGEGSQHQRRQQTVRRTGAP